MNNSEHPGKCMKCGGRLAFFAWGQGSLAKILLCVSCHTAEGEYTVYKDLENYIVSKEKD